MSLFNHITWWSAAVDKSVDNGTEEGFCMCVSRFSSFTSAEDLEKEAIFVGSLSGNLSIFQPSDSLFERDIFLPTDVILEQNLNAPILQIQCGKFAMTRNENRYCLAVLHPYKLSCYWIVMADGVAEHGKQFKLNLAFEYKLTKHGFSLCKGGFGGVRQKEFLCITHLDGSLRFFEQDGIASEAKLPPGRTIPSQILYLSRVDCFVTVAMPEEQLECYKYQDLIQSAEGKPISPVWTYCVGEFVLEMATHQITNSESVIVILGEHNLICLTDTGIIKFVKKLDYTPISFYSFVIGWYYEPDARLMIAIASDLETLFLYEFTKLVWCSKLPFSPISVARASFDGISGAMVLLSDSGTINVGFLGTDPQTFKVPPLQNNSINMEKAQLELKELEEEIKRGIDFTDLSYVNAAANRDLQVAVKIRSMSNGNPEEIRVHIRLCPKVVYDQIQLIINTPPPLIAKDRSFIVNNTEMDNDLDMESVICCQDGNPISLDLLIIISSINRQGIPRILERRQSLPLELFFEMCPPQKESKYKVTISAESTSTKSLSSLFPDFNSLASQQQQQAIGFKSRKTGAIVTIVLAKNTNRYRVQSDELMPINPVLQALLLKLEKPSSHLEQNRDIVIHPSFFADELLSTIDEHSEKRRQLKSTDSEIERLSVQMRLFQKKLTLKLQEDPPNPTFNSAAKLVRITHNEMMELQEKLNVSVKSLKQSQVALSAHLELIKTIIRFCKIPKQLKDQIQATFVTPVMDWIEISWEETMAPCLEILTHIGVLSKNKNQEYEEIASYSQIPYDLERLKKNIKTMFDKIEKLIETGKVDDTEDDAPKKETVEDSDWLNKEELTEAAEESET